MPASADALSHVGVLGYVKYGSDHHQRTSASRSGDTVSTPPERPTNSFVGPPFYSPTFNTKHLSYERHPYPILLTNEVREKLRGRRTSHIC